MKRLKRVHQAEFLERLTERFTVRIKMAIPIKNHILEKIREKENFTDKELEKLLSKEGTIITEGKFNKVLLDLEIMGLISVSWVTKDNRRIQAVTEKIEEDEYEEQIKETQEKDYEASFPSS